MESTLLGEQQGTLPIERPPLPIQKGKEAFDLILGTHSNKLFSNDDALTNLTVEDIAGRDANGQSHSLITGTLTNGTEFIVGCRLNGDTRTPSHIFMHYQGGAVRVYHLAEGVMDTYLADAAKPETNDSLRERFLQELQFGRPSIRQQYLAEHRAS